MIINTLTLKNFKSHKNTRINFDGNISLILGKNGAGKSSILEAISYCLFKEFNGKKIDNILRKSKEEDDVVKDMNVTLEFTHDNIDYKLERGRKGKQSKVKLWQKINDEYVTKFNGDKEVTRDIQRILQLDSKSFLNAVYIKQGDITDLLDKNPAERKELIAKLLNIDSFETAWNEIKNLQDIYRKKIEYNDNELTKKDTIEEEKESITENIDNNKKKLEILIPEITKLDKLLKEEELELSKLENNKVKYDNLLKQKKMMDSNLETRTNEKDDHEKKLEQIKTYEQEIISLEKDVKKLPYLEELKEKKEELDKNIEKINENEKIINDIETNIKIKEETCEAHSNRESISKELEELNTKKEEFNKTYLEYQKIVTQINEKKDNVARIRRELQQASEDATELFGQYFNSPESIERTVTDEKEKTEHFIDTLTDQINKNTNEISVLRNDSENIQKSLDELKHTKDICPICQSKISADKHEELSNRYNEELVDISLRIENLEDSNKSQNKKLDDKREYLEKINSIRIEVLKDKNNVFKDLSAEIKNLEGSLDEYSGVKASLDEADNQIKELENKRKTLEEDDKRYYFAINKLKELGSKEEYLEENNRLNEKNKVLKAKCHDIVVRYAVGDDLVIQIKHLRDKEKRFNMLKGSVQDKESTINIINNLTNEITSITNELNNTEEEIKSIEYDQNTYDKKNKTYTSNKEELEKKKALKIQLETENNKDTEIISEYDKELEKLKEKEEEQKNLKDYTKLLEQLREVYSKDGVQKRLRKNVEPLITKETIDIFNNFDFDYTDMTLDEDYNIKLYNKNEELDTNMISGGEKIVVALALRLGIAKVLSKNKTDLLILDEPTIHLDEDRRQRLIGIIREINFVPQMLVVTHDDEMETLSNNIIKIKKENGISFIEE
ncbi:MAG: hypothetical protein BZ138_05415 [Methanosphaera sp. rholeuAM270]|nr:MAG: hypothetical protein BZ138_05415 [Methanosphaera sp. rholeuAM270]